MSSKMAALVSCTSLRVSSPVMTAADEDAIVGDFSRALRVRVGAVLSDGVRERDDDADE